VASGFAALSAVDLDHRRAATLRRMELPLRLGLVIVLAAWAAASLTRIPSLDRIVESERAPWLLAVLPFGIAVNAFAALRYASIYRERRRIRQGVAPVLVGVAPPDGGRVGVNSGPAIIGNVGAGAQRSFTAIGDTTNVAARLQALAEPGQVVIAGGTLRAAGDRLEVEALGAHLLKGRTETTDAFELLALQS
jgi:class 3 adenylate cyclase